MLLSSTLSVISVISLSIVLLFTATSVDALPPTTNAHLASTLPKKAVYDAEYAKIKKYRDKGDKEHKAQFKEDIVVYEQYFYGMKNGVILESGALDGLLYSTSYMFEKHFDWKAIHIGIFLIVYS